MYTYISKDVCTYIYKDTYIYRWAVMSTYNCDVGQYICTYVLIYMYIYIRKDVCTCIYVHKSLYIPVGGDVDIQLPVIAAKNIYTGGR